MEPTICNAPLPTSKSPKLDKKASIHVHSKRRRLADPDGISAKAIVDGLVIAGILEDDNARFVEKISFTQEQCKTAETIIDITWGVA